jgi:hypothetical protein
MNLIKSAARSRAPLNKITENFICFKLLRIHPLCTDIKGTLYRVKKGNKIIFEGITSAALEI